MNVLHISEIVDLGIEKEKKRRDFYAKVADNFKEPALNKLFTQLSGWEDIHIKKFTEIRNSISEDSISESYLGELGYYMEEVVNDKLYSTITAAEFSKHIKSELDAINYGFQFEKDAILFFAGLNQYVDGVNKQVIQKLIDEEKQHIIYLSEIKKKMGEKFT